MDRKALGLKLRELNEEKYPDPTAFTKAAKLEPWWSSRSNRWLRIVRLGGWAETCGTRLFMSLEPRAES